MLKIMVPATTANIGPGFDCLGMALELYNTLEIASSDEGTHIRYMAKEQIDCPVPRTI